MKKIHIAAAVLILALGLIWARLAMDVAPEEPKIYQPTEHSLEDGLDILVATDLHYLSPQLNDRGPLFMRVTERGDGKVTHWSPELTEAFMAQALELEPDVLILSGDLSYNGEAQSHRDLAAMLRRLSDAGILVLALPGNHDLDNLIAVSFSGEGYSPTETISPQDFAQIYAPLGYDQALSRDDSSLSYTVQLCRGLRALMLDCNGGVYPGRLGEETLAWAEEQLKEAQAAGDRVISVTHQNLLSHNELLVDGYLMDGRLGFLKLLESYPVICNLSGHIHMQHIAQKDGLIEIVTSSLAVSPDQFGLLHLEDGKASYETRTVDVAAWARSQGLKDPELLDFQQTSLQFFLDTGYRQAGGGQGGTQEQEDLAGFFARLNAAYFAGRLDRFQLDQELYELSQAQGGFFAQYIESIVAEIPTDHTRLSFTYQ